MENPSFVTDRYVRFADVDAAGWLYYPRFFEYCHNAFEDWVNTKGPVNYPQAIDVERWGFPAVKCVGEYLSPLKHGDTARISLKPIKVGRSSLVTAFEIHNGDMPSFKGEITTVCVDLEKGKSMPIPEGMRNFLG
jgi:4-hydroxybenzoyl-CoA thioesterase